MISYYGGRPVHCRYLSASLASNPLNASSTRYPPLSYDSQKCLQMLPNIPWGGGKIIPSLRTTDGSYLQQINAYIEIN